MSFNKILVTLLILLTGLGANSQQLKFGNFDVYNNYMRGDYNRIDYPSTIIGSPYMNDGYRLGYLFLEDKDAVAVPLRYNIVEEKFQVRIEEDNFLIEDNIEIELDGVLYKKIQYKQKGNGNLPTMGYFKILTKDPEDKKLVLLEKPLKIVQAGQNASAMKTSTPTRYKDGSDLYLIFQGAKLAIITERNVNNFIEIFPLDLQEDIKSYIKKNKLKTNKEEDLHLIVNYYNNTYK